MKRAALLLAALSVCSGATTVRAQEPAAGQWLDRMVDAAARLHYAGDVIYIAGNNTSNLRLVHMGGADGGSDRLYSRGGAYWELRRAGGKVSLMLPAQAPPVLAAYPQGGNFALMLPLRLRALDAAYTLVEVGSDRVAGRAVRVLTAAPADAYRYGFRLGVDEASGLLLRAVLLDSAEVPIEQMFFTSVGFMEGADGRDQAAAAIIAPTAFKLVEYPLGALPAAAPWQAGWLPEGFTLRDYMRSERGPEGRPVEQMLYSDGLTSLSVFVEPLEPESTPLKGPVQAGVMNAYASVVQDYQITVIGAAPELAVRLVAEHFEPRLASTVPPPQ